MSNITDLTGTTWYFNDTPSFDSSTHTYNINFTTSQALSGYTQFIYLKTSWIKSVYYGVADTGDITAYGYFTDPNAQEWASEGCRTISITGGTDATNSGLIEWLSANATYVSMLVSSIQLPSGEVYSLKDAISGYITADNIKPGENIIFTEDSEGNTVINGAGGGGGSSSAYVDQHLLVINTDILSGDEVSY